MQFEEKIEKATFPLITDLRRKIALLPTIDVLNHYQYRINLSQFNKDKLPDGFWAKGRYVSGLLLANRYLDKAVQAEESPLTLIDELVEEIYDCYALGAVFEPGQTPGSETEFLTRLGVGLNVREPDALGFPEQFIQWAAVRFEPFNESYFLPVLGLTYAAIVEWLDRLSSAIESRLNTLIDVLRSIMNDVEGLREEFAAGKLSVEGARERSDHLKIGERMDANGRDFDSAHIFAYEDLKQGIPESNARILLEMFAIRPGDVPMEFNFPHDANPLDRKFLVHLPNANFYFLDPASAHRVAARVFENAILGDEKLRARYLRNRDRATEKLVSESARQVFLSSTIRANYYLEKGSHEKDL